MGLEERGWGRVPEGRTLRVTPPSFGNPQKANEGSPLLQTFTSAQHTRGGVGAVESYVKLLLLAWFSSRVLCCGEMFFT